MTGRVPGRTLPGSLPYPPDSKIPSHWKAPAGKNAPTSGDHEEQQVHGIFFFPARAYSPKRAAASVSCISCREREVPFGFVPVHRTVVTWIVVRADPVRPQGGPTGFWVLDRQYTSPSRRQERSPSPSPAGQQPDGRWYLEIPLRDVPVSVLIPGPAVSRLPDGNIQRKR